MAGFARKNKDELSDELHELLFASSCAWLLGGVNTGGATIERRTGKMRHSMAAQFRASLR